MQRKGKEVRTVCGSFEWLRRCKGGELRRWKGNFGGGRVELTKELNWEKNRTEPKIEVQRIEETPPRVEGRLSKGSCCAEKEALSASSSLYPLNSTHWDNSWRENNGVNQLDIATLYNTKQYKTWMKSIRILESIRISD